MNKARIIATIGAIFIIIGLGIQIIQYQSEIDNLTDKLDKAYTQIIKLEEENNSLWDNYYMNVSEYDGEYYE